MKRAKMICQSLPFPENTILTGGISEHGGPLCNLVAMPRDMARTQRMFQQEAGCRHPVLNCKINSSSWCRAKGSEGKSQCGRLTWWLGWAPALWFCGRHRDIAKAVVIVEIVVVVSLLLFRFPCQPS